MRRRAFFLLANAVIAASAALLSAVHAAPNRPNILILYADDLGYGDLGCDNPASKIPTPQLDRLASQGMRFTDGHSSSAPNRAAKASNRSGGPEAFDWSKPIRKRSPSCKPC
jgi:arylsulfatase A